MFFNFTTPKFAAQAISKVDDLGWKPMQFITNVSASVGGVLKPAGLENSQGMISAAYLKDPTDPQWKNDRGHEGVVAFMKKYYPGRRSSRRLDRSTATSSAQTLVQVLKQCGDDLTRENVMKQAANLKNFELATLLPGITINTSRPTTSRSSKCS